LNGVFTVPSHKGRPCRISEKEQVHWTEMRERCVNRKQAFTADIRNTAVYQCLVAGPSNWPADQLGLWQQL
jgi:hypothetical protein